MSDNIKWLHPEQVSSLTLKECVAWLNDPISPRYERCFLAGCQNEHRCLAPDYCEAEEA